jgi:hypothetical protein
MMRFAVGALVVVVLAVGSGCGGSSAKTAGTSAGPNTQGVLLTVLSYGRAASAKEVCPLLSQNFRKRTGGGDPAKCATLGRRTLCPCVSQSLATNSISVLADKATAKVTRANGTTAVITLVRQGADWKIDGIKRGA